MVCQLPPIRIRVVSQPCTEREGLAALAKSSADGTVALGVSA